MTTDKTAVVTGGTSGLGEATALALAKAGWRVVVVGRDEARGRQVVSQAGPRASFVAADLFSVSGVAALGATLRAQAPRLDLLINNAGGSFQTLSTTPDGLERTFALNVLAPFALTRALVPSLRAGHGRVVNVVTGVPHGAKATLEQLAGPRASAGMPSYLRSKLALIALTREQARRFAGDGVSVASLHPGIIPNTRFGAELPKALLAVGQVIARLFRLASTLDQAAERFMRIGTGPIEAGGYYKEGRLSPPPPWAADPRFGEALWTRLEALAPVDGQAAAPGQRGLTAIG